MGYRILADGVVVLHLAFVLYVAAGGFLSFRLPRNAWLHVPALLWGAWIEWSGSVCPLTPLENRLRSLAGEGEYRGGFIAHYLETVLYPAGLTRSVQVILGVAVLGGNLLLYAAVIAYRRRSAGRREDGSR